MAGLTFRANSGDVSLVANTPKTVLQVKAPTNQRVRVTAREITVKDAPSSTNTGIKIRYTYSTANFGTGTAVTPVKIDQGRPESINSTAASNFSTEPTSPTDLGDPLYIQYGSGIVEDYSVARSPWIGGGAAINVECTAPASATISITLTCEE